MYRPGSGLSPRRVLWLVEHLPEGAAFYASRQGGTQFRGWTPQTYLLAGVVNLLNAANRQRAGKRTREPLVRPPGKQVARKVRTVAQIAAARRMRIEPNN